MTHTLHRVLGLEERERDFVVLVHSAKGINIDTAATQFRRFLELAARHDPVNLGGAHRNLLMLGNDRAVRDGVTSGTGGAHAVFTDADTLTRFLDDLVKEQLGISVVVSGPFETVARCCHRVGLAPHTVEYSAGVLGKTARLPDAGVLKITTMCGHAMISHNLVRHFASAVAAGTVTPREAAVEMGRLCVCGVFNPVRAEELIAELAGSPPRTPDGEVAG